MAEIPPPPPEEPFKEIPLKFEDLKVGESNNSYFKGKYKRKNRNFS